MEAPPILTDRLALSRNRARSKALDPSAMFLHHHAADEVKQRLQLVNRTFTSPAVVTGFSELWADITPNLKIVADTDTLDLIPKSHDLVVHGMALHWANDPVGQLVQARRALYPDGLFLGILFGGETLKELRTCLGEAEAEITGGLSPRIAPMGEIRQLGSLLQRAGFALPVADSVTYSTSYETAYHLMRDLRAMGETNALAQRNRQPMRRAILELAAERYSLKTGTDGRISATFELIILTGWAPDPSQPKPLRPGSANSRLADALDTKEHKLGQPPKTN
ncbi:MAG: methyltransferase domain-containing protein [Paracoccaceae bacterium]